LLSSPSVSTQGQSLATAAVPLAAEVRTMIEHEREQAYAAGRAAGIAEAAASELDAAGAAATALRATVEQEIARLRDASAAHDAAAIELATQIATYIIDAVDTSAVAEVARRIRAALDQIDDSDVVAHVQADQVDAVARAVADTGVRVVAAEGMTAGDVRLVGRWSIADLSLQQRWTAVQELLDAAT
jgi:flagellar biosynthesis/type III secretory pathway protein FliH